MQSVRDEEDDGKLVKNLVHEFREGKTKMEMNLELLCVR